MKIHREIYKRRKSPAVVHAYHYTMMIVGSVLAAIGLEIFLIPNNIIDGGIVGISIMVAYITHLPLGVFTFLLNIPFLYWGYKQIGKTFVISAVLAIASFSLFVSFFHPVPGITKDVLLAAVFGGIILGVGVGIIIRFGGSLDGTEMVAIVLSKKSSFSVGQFVMFFNVFILGAAGLLFGWDRAMYSLIAYFIAFKAIDIVVEGIDESKSVMIISDEWKEIAKVIAARLGRTVSLLHSDGENREEQSRIIYVVVTRIEMAKLKSIVLEMDEDASIAIQNTIDVIGKINRKKSIH